MTSYKTGSRKWKVYPAANKQHMFQVEKSSNSVREKSIGSNPSGNLLFRLFGHSTEVVSGIPRVRINPNEL